MSHCSNFREKRKRQFLSNSLKEEDRIIEDAIIKETHFNVIQLPKMYGELADMLGEPFGVEAMMKAKATMEKKQTQIALSSLIDNMSAAAAAVATTEKSGIFTHSEFNALKKSMETLMNRTLELEKEIMMLLKYHNTELTNKIETLTNTISLVDKKTETVNKLGEGYFKLVEILRKGLEEVEKTLKEKISLLENIVDKHTDELKTLSGQGKDSSDKASIQERPLCHCGKCSSSSMPLVNNENKK